MPSTYLSLHYHLIFSTKERHRIIADPWRERLHAYLGGAVRWVVYPRLSVEPQITCIC
jgi:REP element-mobilizing transposase RayT